MTETERDYYKQAQALAEARIRFAQAFQIARSKGGTDQNAYQAAVEMTSGEIILFEAAMKIAEVRLVNESERATRQEWWDFLPGPKVTFSEDR